MRYKFFISQLPKGSSDWTWQVGRELLATIGADYGIQDLSVEARVHAIKDDRHLRLEVQVDGWVEVECDRGQEVIRLPIAAQHQQVYAWDEYYLPAEEVEEFFPLGPREDEIDLTQALYDYIGLAIPRRRVRAGCPDAHCPAYVRIFLDMSEGA